MAQQIFEWIGRFVICIIIGLIVRLAFDYFGARETTSALYSGIALAVSMFETGILKAGFKK